jgi:hypothetical protein
MELKEIAKKANVPEDIIISSVMAELRNAKKFLREQVDMVENENKFLQTNIDNYNLNEEWKAIQDQIRFEKDMAELAKSETPEKKKSWKLW